MDIQEIFCQKNSIDGGFLQSSHWKAFQERLGREVFEEGDGENIQMIAIRYNLPLVGGYFFIPRGPIISVESSKCKVKSGNAGNSLKKIIELAKGKKLGWVRVEPQREEDLSSLRETAKELGYQIVKSKKNHEPAETLMVDLSKSEDGILSNMKPKTRYNIRLAQKKGVTVRFSKEKKDVDSFWNIMVQTSQRDKITPHPKSYYSSMIDLISEQFIRLYIAEFQGETVAGAITSFYGGVASYLHGASSNKHRNTMAPYLLQWQMMKDAKEKGCTRYDLGGVSTIKSLKFKVQSWEGITKFKSGFCPNCETVVFPGCWDIILDKKKYWLYSKLQIIKGLLT